MPSICRFYGAVGKVCKGDDCKVYAKYLTIVSKTYAKHMQNICRIYADCMVQLAKWAKEASAIYMEYIRKIYPNI